MAWGAWGLLNVRDMHYTVRFKIRQLGPLNLFKYCNIILKAILHSLRRDDLDHVWLHGEQFLVLKILFKKLPSLIRNISLGINYIYLHMYYSLHYM